MVIDMYARPEFIEDTGMTEEKFENNRQLLGLYKTDSYDLDSWEHEIKVNGIDRLCLLPLACEEAEGGYSVTNEDVAKMVSLKVDALATIEASSTMNSVSCAALKFRSKRSSSDF